MMVRYCSACDTEFQPHVVRCSDCGADLVDRWLSDDGEDVGGARPESSPAEAQEPAEAHRLVAQGLASEEAARAARRLARAGLRFQVVAHGFTHDIRVPEGDAAAAQKALGALALPVDSINGAAAVGEVGGPCPACGAEVKAGAEECPECGLCVASRPSSCPECGETLDAAGERCSQCGWVAASEG